MIVDPGQVAMNDIYRVLTSVVVPRPIALVSTRDRAGHLNLAPFSYFNAISSRPPLIGIAINERPEDPKDTLVNIRETGEFVVNVVTEPLLEPMVRTAGEWPRAVSEFEVAGLTPRPSQRVGPPGVAESPVQLECRLHRDIPLGNSVLVVGEVVLVAIDDAVVEGGRIVADRLPAVGRLSQELYALQRELRRVDRPRVARSGAAS